MARFNSASSRHTGFTLVEVLVALVIAATALALGFGAVQGSARRLSQVEERTLAGWALDNAVNDLILRATTIEPGRHRYVETMLGRTLVLEADVARAEAPPRLVIDVAVKDVVQPARELDRTHVETLVDFVAGQADANLPR
ncbi:MAG: type II secretion system minor pseudopilin GspI [Gammaproteobacteria bacterium]